MQLLVCRAPCDSGAAPIGDFGSLVTSGRQGKRPDRALLKFVGWLRSTRESPQLGWL